MERATVARSLRAIRRRKRWSQRTLGDRLGVSQATVSRWERTALEDCTVVQAERWAIALGGHASIELRFQGEPALTDEKHAAIQNWLVGLLRHAGWVVEAEVSFNHYGDRGRIDVMALHSSLSCLLVAEIKTRIVDVQELLGGVDVKRRIARTLATERGWPATSVVGAIVVRESTTTRRRLQAHRDLFAGYGVRGRAGMAWLRRPRTPIPKGILALVTAPDEPN